MKLKENYKVERSIGFVHLLESIVVGLHHISGKEREYVNNPDNWPKHLLQLRIEFEIKQMGKKKIFSWLGLQSK